MVDIPEEMYLSLLLSIRRTFTKSLSTEKVQAYKPAPGFGGAAAAPRAPGKGRARGVAAQDTAQRSTGVIEETIRLTPKDLELCGCCETHLEEISGAP